MEGLQKESVLSITSPRALAVEVRAATAGDATAIRALVRAQPRMNPTGLLWPRFVVADRGGVVVGTVQLRPAGAGAAELGSLVVRPDLRGMGLAARLIAATLERAEGPVFVITVARHAAFYARFGFLPVAPWRSPMRVALNWTIGQAASATRLLEGRWPRRMAVLRRVAACNRGPQSYAW